MSGHSITNIRYADDTVLFSESEKDLQRLLNVVVKESERMGLEINYTKTKCLVVSKKSSPKCNLKLKEQIIKQVSSFNYLGSMITEDARCEIKRRIALAKSAFSKLGKILTNRTMSMRTRIRVLNCYIYPVLMYGSETWTLASDTKKRLESFEMWFLRRMMKIPWTDKVSNEEVLTRAGVQRKMICEMLIRQLKFMGHITCKEGLENLALTGKIVGRRSRGRRRILRMDSLQKLLKERGSSERTGSGTSSGISKFTKRRKNLLKVLICIVHQILL